MSFDRDGFEIFEKVLDSRRCAEIDESTRHLSVARAGTRNLLDEVWCRDLARWLSSHARLAPILPTGAVAVQCTWFEKSSARNWSVAMHRDQSIAVAAKVDHPVLRGWHVKEGKLFVQPPLEWLANLVAIRLHLDDCRAQDGPLKVISQSHRLPISERVAGSDGAEKIVECVVGRGGVVALRPLLLHASSKSHGSGRRRVLHFLFGPAQLPGGLKWAAAIEGAA